MLDSRFPLRLARGNPPEHAQHEKFHAAMHGTNPSKAGQSSRGENETLSGKSLSRIRIDSPGTIHEAGSEVLWCIRWNGPQITPISQKEKKRNDSGNQLARRIKIRSRP
jgi:hypothetical protein